MSTLELTLPFFIGPSDNPTNYNNFPDLASISLNYDRQTGLLTQLIDQNQEKLLQNVYQYGSTMGHAMSDDGIGKKYAEDFLEYCTNWIPPNSNLLEIGCAHGYLLKLLVDKGFHCTGIEPGNCYSRSWDNYKVKVVNDTYPSNQLPSKYDAIISYGVLEHMEDPLSHLKAISK